MTRNDRTRTDAPDDNKADDLQRREVVDHFDAAERLRGELDDVEVVCCYEPANRDATTIMRASDDYRRRIEIDSQCVFSLEDLR